MIIIISICNYFNLDANLKLQANIDRVLNIFEETSRQLLESNSIQNQLADKLEECQQDLANFKVKYQNLEIDFDEKQNDALRKINNLEGRNFI